MVFRPGLSTFNEIFPGETNLGEMLGVYNKRLDFSQAYDIGRGEKIYEAL